MDIIALLHEEEKNTQIYVFYLPMFFLMLNEIAYIKKDKRLLKIKSHNLKLDRVGLVHNRPSPDQPHPFV